MFIKYLGLIIGIVLSKVVIINCIYAYDCAADGLNITSLSLLDVDPCPDYITEDISENVSIQILQQRETYEVRTYRCSIHYRYHITHCGMHSHSSRVRDGEGVGLWNLGESECKEIHRTRKATIMGINIIELSLNSSDTRMYTIAGNVERDGTCTGGTLKIGINEWNDVYGTVELSITLHDFTSIHRVVDNMLLTPTGVKCPFKDGSCVDVELGFLCWDQNIRSKCDRTSYHVLYSGKAQKVTIVEQSSNVITYTMYSVKSNGFLATLLRKDMIEVCGMEMFTTDHTKLLVQEVVNGVKFFASNPINVKDMDLFLYVNAKFTHLERHTRTEMMKMYTVMMKDICETKRQTLRTLLTIASIDPVEFAYTYMNKPGYTALLMGEVINIIQCKPIYATKVSIDACFLEMPVNYTNKIYYMSPKSHILQKTGTPLTCTPFMKPTYQLHGKWFGVSHYIEPAVAPEQMTVSMQPKWIYTDAGDLAKEGIYSEEDISQLRNQIMYPSERKAISQTISAAINQDSVILDTTFFKNLITKEALEESMSSFIGSTWKNFITLGTFFSGIFGIMMCLKLLKILFDTIVNTRGLYEIYGVSWKLMAGIWDAATTYLLSPHRVNVFKNATNNSQKPKDPPPYNDQLSSLEVKIESSNLTDTIEGNVTLSSISSSDNNDKITKRVQNTTSSDIAKRPQLYPKMSDIINKSYK